MKNVVEYKKVCGLIYAIFAFLSLF